MKKNVLISMSLLMVLGITACGNANVSNGNADNTEITAEPITDQGDADADSDYQDPLPAEEDDGSDAPDVITDEQALDAVKNFIASTQPDAVNTPEDVTEYFVVESSEPEEIVVLYRSYTASQTRFYINRQTGETKVTELVPGIIDEETETGEEFNIKNFMGDGDVTVAAYSDEFLMNYAWSTVSMVTDADGNTNPEWDVRFEEDTIEYGHFVDGQFVLDHTDKISSLEQTSEHRFTIQAETESGAKYTYKTAENDENLLEYYGTWEESEFDDNYSGSSSLFR